MVSSRCAGAIGTRMPRPIPLPRRALRTDWPTMDEQTSATRTKATRGHLCSALMLCSHPRSGTPDESGECHRIRAHRTRAGDHPKPRLWSRAPGLNVPRSAALLDVYLLVLVRWLLLVLLRARLLN